MDKWIIQTKDSEWKDHIELDGKLDLSEVKVFAKIYAATFYPSNAEYRVIARHDFQVGNTLTAKGLWRIQIKYKDDPPGDEIWYDDFKNWQDINVLKADGYGSYEEAFKALKDFEFEKYNETFIWRIIQD